MTSVSAAVETAGLGPSSQRRVELAMRLPQLQNLIKRDPEAYREEFEQQRRHFLSELQIFRLNPSAHEQNKLGSLVNFLAHVVPCYRDCRDQFPGQLMSLLYQHGPVLAPDLRRTIVQSLLLLRNRNVTEAAALLPLLFHLFQIPDKDLRVLMYSHVVADVKRINLKSKDSKANRDVKTFVHGMLSDEQEETAERKALDIMIELYRKRIWVDHRTVNVIGTGCSSKRTKVAVAAMHFFLGVERKMAEDDAAEAESAASLEVNEHRHSKKTGARVKKVERQRKAKRKRIEVSQGDKEPQPLFPALLVLNDPQSLAESLFRKLRTSNENFEVRLLLMNMISRLIGCHKLHLLSFYNFVQRYLSNHQKEVTQILAYLVQATHELVPPDDMVPVVKTIAHNFIADRCPDEVIAVGINAVREVVVRVPSILLEPGFDDFVQDLAMYGRSHDKSVTIAARGFINLVRSQQPTLLHRKDRGKDHVKDAKVTPFGAVVAMEGVDGAELLDDDVGDEEWEGQEEEGGEECDEDMKEHDDEEEDDSEQQDGETEEEEEVEEEEEEVEEEEVETTGPKSKRRRVDACRILGPEDFEKIRRLREEQREAAGADDDSEDESASNTADLGFDPSSLEAYGKKRRQSIEERMESVLRGRVAFEFKKHAGGLTNKEQKRKKNHAMIRHSQHVRDKMKQSTKKLQRGHRNKVKTVVDRDKRKRRRT